MEKDLIKFYNNITFINKELAKYEDEKGNIQILPIGQLICGLSYNELEEKQFENAKFGNLIDGDLEYKKDLVKKAVNKFEITKNKRDKNTIVDKEVEIYKIWILQNGLNISKSFNNLEEAKKKLEEINNKILKQAELI
jgi:hypothetical protein